MREKADPVAMPMSADALPMSILRKMEKLDVKRTAGEGEENKLTAFADGFLHRHVSDDEIAMVRRLVTNAVKDGETEAMATRFPGGVPGDVGSFPNRAPPAV